MYTLFSAGHVSGDKRTRWISTVQGHGTRPLQLCVLVFRCRSLVKLCPVSSYVYSAHHSWRLWASPSRLPRILRCPAWSPKWSPVLKGSLIFAPCVLEVFICKTCMLSSCARIFFCYTPFANHYGYNPRWVKTVDQSTNSVVGREATAE